MKIRCRSTRAPSGSEGRLKLDSRQDGLESQTTRICKALTVSCEYGFFGVHGIGGSIA
jgi:hypothetical protein